MVKLMKNEEKVLSILEQMQGDMAKIQGDIAKMQGDITELKESQTNMQDDITELKESQASMQGDIAKMQDDTTNLKAGQLDLQEQINSLEVHTTKEHELTRSELKAEIDYVYRELKEDMNMIEMVVAKKWYNTTKEEVMKDIRVME